ncbi:MAG: hypothetical protein TQ35_0001385 [Candidatus Aramenus sulfurataquae]|jgi:hypothetical protein|uniref:Uncharacterized protein n=3 Tax=Candidatus Aramenus sulfurataquae TaxID=1326980 RepID=A0A0F2LRY6_9CREN|nr:hypothetical protein [Candidatus Aramenus sulfurataquae]
MGDLIGTILRIAAEFIPEILIATQALPIPQEAGCDVNRYKEDRNNRLYEYVPAVLVPNRIVQNLYNQVNQWYEQAYNDHQSSKLDGIRDLINKLFRHGILVKVPSPTWDGLKDVLYYVGGVPDYFISSQTGK